MFGREMPLGMDMKSIGKAKVLLSLGGICIKPSGNLKSHALRCIGDRRSEWQIFLHVLKEKHNFDFTDVSEAYSIPAQPIPKELLEMEEPKKEILISHPEERMLWLQQRIAGTNEQWRVKLKSLNDWEKIPIDEEPEWSPECDYNVVETVKYYFCLCRRKNGDIVTMSRTSKDRLKYAVGDATIIGNIEEREVEV